MTEYQFLFISYMLCVIAFNTSEDTFPKVMYGSAMLLIIISMILNVIKSYPQFYY